MTEENVCTDRRCYDGRRLRRRLYGVSFVILLVSLSFTAGLLVLTLEKGYTESLVDRYRVIGSDLERRIEQSIRFGKPLENFLGMDALLSAGMQYFGEYRYGGDRIDILLSDGTIRYSTSPDLTHPLWDREVEDFITRVENKRRELKKPGRFLLFSPIEDRNGDRIGTLLMTVDSAPLEASVSRMLAHCLTAGLVVLVVGVICVMVLIWLLLPRERRWLMECCGMEAWQRSSLKREFPTRQISWAVFAVICLCQISFTAERLAAYRKDTVSLHMAKAEIVSHLLRDEVNHLLYLGLPIENLFKVEVLLGRAVKRLPEVAEIRITDAFGKWLYAADQNEVRVRAKGDLPEMKVDAVTVRLALTVEDRVAGFLVCRLSEKVMGAAIRSLYLDAGTVLLISIFFCVELLFLVFRKENGHESTAPVAPYVMIRPMAFFFFFGTDIAISFLPLHMDKIYTPMGGLSRETVLGLPITVQMAFTALAFLIAGNWSDKRGWQAPFLCGLLLSAAGFMAAGATTNPFWFLTSLAAVGYGYGLSYMAAQSFVVTVAPPAERAMGFSELYAGCIAGSICGGAAGALLADRTGYAPVFWMGAVVLLGTFPATWKTLGGFFGIRKRQKKKTARKPLFRFFGDLRIFAVILFSSFPAAIALIGFMNYFSPLYLNKIGASQSTIGRVFMIYGVCIIYVAPVLTRWIGQKRSPTRLIVVSGILGSFAFLFFRGMEGVMAVAIGILFLGLAACFNAARNAFAMNLPVTREVGEGRAMGAMFFVARLGQASGPLLFSWLIGWGGGDRAILFFGAAYLAATLLFALVSFRSMEEES